MKASALFLGFTLAVLAGALTLLWQAFGPRSAPPSAPAAKRETPALAAAPRMSEPEQPGVRSVYPGARPSAARPSQSPQDPTPQDPPQASPQEAPRQQDRTTAPPQVTAPAPDRSADAEPPLIRGAPELAPEPESAKTGGVDLNTASLEQLNELGAGMIGKTIVANRPYTTPDDLVARRVLTRRDFETIRPHVTVR